MVELKKTESSDQTQPSQLQRTHSWTSHNDEVPVVRLYNMLLLYFCSQILKDQVQGSSQPLSHQQVCWRPTCRVWSNPTTWEKSKHFHINTPCLSAFFIPFLKVWTALLSNPWMKRCRVYMFDSLSFRKLPNLHFRAQCCRLPIPAAVHEC